MTLDSVIAQTLGSLLVLTTFVASPESTRAGLLAPCFLDIAVKIFSWITPDHENFTTRNIIARKFYNTKISQYTVLPGHMLVRIDFTVIYTATATGITTQVNALTSKTKKRQEHIRVVWKI